MGFGPVMRGEAHLLSRTTEPIECASPMMSVAVAQAKADPLEEFCDDNPEADECRCFPTSCSWYFLSAFKWKQST